MNSNNGDMSGIGPRGDLWARPLAGWDLSSRDLNGADLSHANLSGADLTGTDLLRALLFKACLQEATMRSTKLEGAEICGADLSSADLTKAMPSSGCVITAPRTGLARLHLVDLDNLHGSGDPDIRRINRVRTDYEELGIHPGDLLYGAYNHDPRSKNSEQTQRTFRIRSLWPGTVRLAHGKNGADHKLIDDANDYVSQGRIADRFADVVIASCDGDFELLVHRIRRVGLTVHLVIAFEQALSPDLERSVDGCIWHLHERRCLRHQTSGARYAIAA